MGHSNLLGTDEAPQEAAGRDDGALGPSESSDSASDCVGVADLPAADPNEPVDVTLSRDIARRPIESGDDNEEAGAGADIKVDRVFDPDAEDRDANQDQQAL